MLAASASLVTPRALATTGANLVSISMGVSLTPLWVHFAVERLVVLPARLLTKEAYHQRR
jgi:hypothetical protein